MSGLLWSALGGAIANTGSTIAQGMMRDAEYRQRIDDEEIREKRRMENQIKLEEERARREDARKETVAKQQADILDRAEKGAEKIGDDRRFEKFRKDARAAGYEADDDTLRKVFNDQYNQRVVGNFEGADRYRERYSKEREDVLNEVRRLGGNSESVRQAREAVSIAQTAERDDARERLQTRREDRRDQERREDRDATNRRLDLIERGQNIRRDGGGGSGGGTGGGKTLVEKSVDMQRKVDNAKEQMLDILGGKESEIWQSLDTVRRKAANGDAKAKEKLSRLEAGDGPYTIYKSASARLQAYLNGDSGDTAPKPSGGGQNGNRPPLGQFFSVNPQDRR